MSAIATILLGLAADIAAPFAKRILADKLGPAAGGVLGSLVDVIAGKLGAEPSELPGLAEADPKAVQEAILASEPEAAELVLAYTESQKLANQLQLAEMAKEPIWAWSWRPAWMWFLGFLWLWRLVIVPTVDASTGSTMAAAIDLTTLGWLTSLIAGLYMGGHTIKDAMSKWMAKPAP